MKITDVKKREVVHCQTEEEAIRICNLMHEAGMKWISGKSYLDEKVWEEGYDLCFYPLGGMFGDLAFYMNRCYKIIPSTEIEAELVPAPEDLFLDKDGGIEIAEGKVFSGYAEPAVIGAESAKECKSIGENANTATRSVKDLLNESLFQSYFKKRDLVIIFNSLSEINRVGNFLDKVFSAPSNGSWVNLLKRANNRNPFEAVAANISTGYVDQVCYFVPNIESNVYELLNSIDLKYNPDVSVPSETKAERHNTGKLQWSLVDFPSLEPMVEVLAFGAAKYGKDNWKQGLSVSSQIDSLLRHVTAIASNDDIDEESKLSHIGHAQCNLMFLAWTLKNKPELDDR